MDFPSIVCSILFSGVFFFVFFFNPHIVTIQNRNHTIFPLYNYMLWHIQLCLAHLLLFFLVLFMFGVVSRIHIGYMNVCIASYVWCFFRRCCSCSLGLFSWNIWRFLFLLCTSSLTLPAYLSFSFIRAPCTIYSTGIWWRRYGYVGWVYGTGFIT